jgi:hypothetical protein
VVAIAVASGLCFVLVIKTEGGEDNLFLLRKTGDHFESFESQPCGFVRLRGRYQFENLEPAVPETTIPEWAELQGKEIDKRCFPLSWARPTLDIRGI